MPASFNVDTETGHVTLQFEDDKGNATDAPAGATVTYSIDNTSVATVTNDATNPLEGDIALAGIEGSFTLSATLSGALEADGVTPIPSPAPQTFPVVAGPADQVVMTVAAS